MIWFKLYKDDRNHSRKFSGYGSETRRLFIHSFKCWTNIKLNSIELKGPVSITGDTTINGDTSIIGILNMNGRYIANLASPIIHSHPPTKKYFHDAITAALRPYRKES